MTALEFVATITSALAWPLTVLALLVVFRRQVRSWLTERPMKLRAGPFEAEWERQAAKAEAALGDQEAVNPSVSDLPKDADLNKIIEELKPISIIERAQGSPLGTIVEASKALELTLDQFLGTGPKALGQQVREARTRGMISAHLAESIDSLRRMRNLAVHGSDVTPAQAVEFVVLTQAVLMQLRGSSWDESTRA